MDTPEPDLDPAACYRALQARDARFDGVIFVGVRSTGIYCRPVCPARTPLFVHCRFFRHAAAAQAAGFRPCLRCRPETAPDLAFWRGTSNTVSRALALIEAGALDGPAASVSQLAARLGVGERQMRRLFAQHLGASPLAVAQTRRVLFAKALIHQTRLPMTEIAAAAGFGSLRRFNESFRTLFARPPGALRRASVTESPVTAGVTLSLRYLPPYDWNAMLGWLATRAIPGVECVADGKYHRAIAEGNHRGTITIAHAATCASLIATIRLPSVRALPAIVARIRRVFDLAADVGRIGAELAADPMLARLVADRPGLRAPGGWDGFELAMRAVLGQQVTLAAARNLAHRLVRAADARLPAPCPATGLTHVFPDPTAVTRADLAGLGMPGTRRATLHALARAALADASLFAPARDLDDAIARLRAIPGIGEWTAQYIALRALREPDAFPASDIGLLRAAAAPDGTRPTPAALLARAEAWRPWRAYAAQHLWAAEPATPKPVREPALA
jgi:AraC family transcriptional regulator of adaptative response / DNA-3-methyladenine glycosylase II